MFTVVTPNFNGARWLDECLNSVAGQTLNQKSIEMIVIDDGSTDSSTDVVRGFTPKIPGLKLVCHPHTGLPGELRNISIEMAVGDYVLFLDSDDFLGAEALERLSRFVDKGDSDVVVFQLVGLGRNVPRSMLGRTIRNANVVASGVFKTLGTWKMCRR